ncbi:hypothetical protein C8R46DRAFT_968979 [Mycena filopes]|nr:hypothetical protein C8R46DRAFT_968979 [Mycena filopes]
MQFSILTIVFVFVTAAVAAHEDTYPLTVTKVVQLGQYNLTYWSDSGTAPIEQHPTARAPACGSNIVQCSADSTVATASICQQLVNSLNGNGNTIANSPRSVCLGQSGNQCCVSWSAPAGNIPAADLFNAANDVLGACTRSGKVSGLARDVQLSGACVTQCLSNRPDGCTT